MHGLVVGDKFVDYMLVTKKILHLILHLWCYIEDSVGLSLTYEYIFKKSIWEEEGWQPPWHCSCSKWNATTCNDIPVAWRGCTLFLMLRQIQLLHDRMHLAAVACIHFISSHQHSHLSSCEWMHVVASLTYHLASLYLLIQDMHFVVIFLNAWILGAQMLSFVGEVMHASAGFLDLCAFAASY